MIPSEEELINYIKKKNIVNFSIIAREFNIHNATVTDLIFKLNKLNKVKVKNLGGSKLVMPK